MKVSCPINSEHTEFFVYYDFAITPDGKIIEDQAPMPEEISVYDKVICECGEEAIVEED